LRTTVISCASASQIKPHFHMAELIQINNNNHRYLWVLDECRRDQSDKRNLLYPSDNSTSVVVDVVIGHP
jgi:hypothetical protein